METAGGKVHSATALAQVEKYIPTKFKSVLRKPLENTVFRAVLDSPRLGLPAGPTNPAIIAGCWACVFLGAHAAIGPNNSLCNGDPDERCRLAFQVASDFITKNFPGHILQTSLQPTSSLRALLRKCGQNGFLTLARKRKTERDHELELARLSRADISADESYRQHGDKPPPTFAEVRSLIGRADFSNKPLAAAMAQCWLERDPQPIAEEHVLLSADPRFAAISLEDVEVARSLIIRRLRKLAADDQTQAQPAANVYDDTTP